MRVAALKLLQVSREMGEQHYGEHQGKPFFAGLIDFITAHQICFNGHKTENLWGVDEWDFFLNDLEENYLNPGGTIALEFNEEPEIGFYTKEVRKYFESRSTRMFRGRVIISFDNLVLPLPPATNRVAATADTL